MVWTCHHACSVMTAVTQGSGSGDISHLLLSVNKKERKIDFKKYLNCIKEMACSTSKSATFKSAILKMIDSPWGWCCHSERWSAAVTGAHSPDPWMWFRSLGMWRSRGTEPKTALMKRKKKQNEKVTMMELQLKLYTFWVNLFAEGCKTRQQMPSVQYRINRC